MATPIIFAPGSLAVNAMPLLGHSTLHGGSQVQLRLCTAVPTSLIWG
jgi:hypothetical protein